MEDQHGREKQPLLLLWTTILQWFEGRPVPLPDERGAKNHSGVGWGCLK